MRERLDRTTGRALDHACERGDALADRGDFDGAIAAFEEAWALLPPPALRWEAATWILTAIGDAQFSAGRFDLAGRALAGAVRAPGGLGNPFIHLRLGQCAFERGELDRAADELMRAYMGDGPRVFEDEDPKYLRFLATRAQGIQAP